MRWNGSARTTTYVSPTQLTTAITAADIASAGTFPVTVFNPTPGGGTSNAVNFTIQAATYPDLIVQSITPSLSSPALNQPVTFTVRIKNQGNADITSSFYLDFYIDTAPGSCPSDGIHWWSVSSLAAGSTQDLTYDYEGFTSAGTHNVYAFADSYCSITESNESNNTLGPIAIAVTNPIPTLTTLSPSSATAGGIAFTLTVNGTNFINGSVVRWNGSPRTTTYVSPTQLTAAITAADIASAGTFPITVFNPTPGGGTSNAVNFTDQ